jgi:DNA/RNA endonuclease G (NUC1)/fibronectin type 3 domain-containing protein
MNTFFRTAATRLFAAGVLVLTSQAALAVSSGVVISQVYGGGGNASAPYTNDFVELYNRGNTPVTITNWTVQYASANGTTWAATTLTGSIPAGGYYLVQLASSGAVGAGLPTADTTGGTNMSATAGKVALVNTTTAQSGGCPAGAQIIDFVGYGSASCSETAVTGAPSATNAVIRKGGGCTETDNNGSDFSVAAPTPRNSATKVTGVSASGGVSQVALAWSAYTGALTTYNVKRSTISGSGYTSIATPTSATLNYTDSTAVNGTTYYYIVQATNCAGDTATSAEVSATPLPAPTVLSSNLASPNPTNAASVNFTVTFDESVVNVDAADFTLFFSGISSPSISNVTGTGSTRTVTVSTGTGSGTLRLDVNNGASINNANGTALSGGFVGGQTYTIDKTAPTATSINRGSASPTNAASVNFTVTFSEAVTGVSAGKFTLAGTGTAGASVGTPTTANNIAWTVPVTTGADGTLRLDLTTTAGITDAAGNAVAATRTGDQSYTVDKTNPSVQSITRNGAPTTAAASVIFDVTFSEPVLNVAQSNFSITQTGLTGAGITGLTGSGASYQVTVNTGTGNGMLRLDFNDNDTVTDATGNPLGGPGPTNGNFSAGETYTIDKSAPSVISIVRGGATNPTNATSVSYTVTFSGSVTGAAAGEFALTTTSGNAAGTIGTPTGSGTTWSVPVSGITGDGGLRLDVVDHDAITATSNGAPLGGTGAGNGNFTGGEVYTFDHTAPSAQSINRASADPTNAASVNFTVTFSEAVFAVTAANFTAVGSGVTGAVVGTPTTSDNISWTVPVTTGSGDGSLRLDLSGTSGIADGVGNALSGTHTGDQSYTVDKTAPTVQSIALASADPSSTTSVDFSVTFSENVTGVDSGDFTITAPGITGTSVSNVAGSGATRTVTVATGSGNGSLRLDVTPSGVIDAAGNALTGTFTGGASYTMQGTPVAPANLAAAPGNAHIALTWDSVSGATGYNVLRSTTPGSGYVSLASPGSNSYDDTSAVNGTHYYYVVTASGARGSGANSNEANGTALAPTAAPAGLTATAGNNHVNLAWTAAVNAATYNVKRSTTSGSGYVTIASPATNSYDDTTAVNGTQYFYVVSAVNVGGESANSTQASATPAPPASSAGVVISQIYGGGNNSGATYQNDYVELFNKSGVAVNLAGWAIQYQSTSGTSFTPATITSGTIAPGGYFLIKNSGGTTNGAPLPAADATLTSLNFSGTNGKIALTNNNVALTCSTTATCIPNNNLADLIGYGTNTNVVAEGGSAAPVLSNTLADFRAAGGCTDTDNNGADFASALPAPRNSLTKVTGVSAAGGVSQVTLSWSAYPGALTTYNVKRSLTSGSGYTSIATPASGTLNYTDSSAANNTQYFYVIQSTNCGGDTAMSAEVTATPLAAPSVSSFIATDSSPTNATGVHYQLVFSQPVSGVDAADFTLFQSGLPSATIGTISGTAPTTTYNITVNTGSGTGTLHLDVNSDASITNANGTAPIAGATGPTYSVDNVAPTVQSINRASAALTNAASVNFTVTFSEAVSSVAAGNFTASGSGSAGAGVGTPATLDGGVTWTVPVTTGADGTLQLDLSSSGTIADLLGNALVGTHNGDQSYSVDRTPPTVQSINRQGAATTAATSVGFDVTFTEPVLNVVQGNFTVNAPSLTGTSITNFSGSGASYAATVSTGSGNGTLELDFADNNTVTDLAGNPIGGAGAGNGDFSGQAYTIDKSSPLVTSIVRAAGSSNPTNGSSIDYTVTFSTPVTGAVAGEFALTTTSGNAAGSVGTPTGSGTTWNVPVGSVTGDGGLRLDVVDHDAITASGTGTPLGGAGNGNGNFSSGEIFTIDHTAPAVQSITRAGAATTNAASVDFTVTFSEAVTGVDAADFTPTASGVTGASVTNVTGSGATRTVTVNSGSGDGTIRLDFTANGTVLDTAGNAAPANFTAGDVVTIDKTAPTVQSIALGSTDPSTASSVVFNVTFSEPVTGVDSGDFALTASGVTGASTTNVSGSGTAYVVTVNSGTGNGTLRLDVTPSGIIDGVGNAMSGNYTAGPSYTMQGTPAAPANLVATAGDAHVALAWNASGGATSYNVKRSTTSGSGYATIATPAGNSHDDTTAVNGTQYFYVVSAVGPRGESANSSEASATPVSATAPGKIVFSQVYAGGGNSGSIYQNDFMELFNSGGTAVSLAGWSVQYTSATGTTWQVTNLSGSIAPGHYYLVQEAVGAGGTTPLPTPEVIGTIPMGAAAGKVALVNSTTALSGACPTGASIIDFVGYGTTANCFEGTGPTPAPSNSTAVFRAQGGCTDTNQNASDFTAGAAAPRNSATAANVCSGGPTNNPPTIAAPANPIATVSQDAAPFTVSLSGSDDGGVYAWSATPGTGIASVSVTGGQGTATVTYTVTVSAGFSGTATFTASLSDTVNPAVTRSVNIQVNAPGGNNSPTITPPANPVTTVQQDAAPFTVGLTGNDDGAVYNWSATPGTGVAAVNVSAGQGTASATFSVTLSAGFNGTATFTASLSDNVNPPVNQAVNISVTAPPGPVNHLVISQLYGGGGNSGATYKNDFVELYNPTASPINVAGWTIQYSSATGTGTFSGSTALGGVIQPGQYYLIALASGGAVGADLPQANVTGDINMSGTAGKLALVSNGDPVGGICGTLLGDPDLVDFIGYGSTANCSEGGATAPAPSNTTADFRKSGGGTDTNNNGSDFFTGAPTPRRTAVISEIGPSITTTDPGSNAVNAPRDANIIVTFSEPVDVDSGWFNINCVTSGVHNDATTAEGAIHTWVILPNTNFAAGEQCTVTIIHDKVHDRDLDDSAPNTDTLISDRLWTFTVSNGTAPPYPATVHLTMGNPSGAVASTSSPSNYLMQKPEMAISYNRDRGAPNWVSWHLTDEWVGSLTRVDTFRADTAVPPDWYRVLGTDFSGSGFDRGHMTPNADRDKETSMPINQATFLMSNMIAQAPDNNQGPWANLENYLRTLLPANELYIVSGPAGTGGTGSAGARTTIANGHVTVPAQTWKVVLVLSKASGDDVQRVTAATRTLAVVMPNVQGIRSVDWHTYITTVDQVEALTGYDFFSNVPLAIQNAIEAGTDGSNPPGAANMSVTAREDLAKAFTLDVASPNSNPLTYTIVTSPSHGSLTGTDASRTYTPAPDFNGTDAFTYRVSDGVKTSNTATVTLSVLEVNDPPVGVNDAKGTDQNTALTFPAGDLTANDSPGPANESGQALTVASVTGDANTHGTVALSSGLVTYQPASPYSGPASFTYRVCDNGFTAGLSDSLCTTATVNVTVRFVCAPPSAAITADAAVCIASGSNNASVPNAGAGATYAWTIGNGVITGGTGTPAITYVAVNPYVDVHLGVTVRVAAGCSASSTRDVPVRTSAPPVIVLQPHSIVGPLGAPMPLAVLATGTNLHYQWFERKADGTTQTIGQDLPLLLAPVTAAPRLFFVRITSGCGTVESADAGISAIARRRPAGH